MTLEDTLQSSWDVLTEKERIALFKAIKRPVPAIQTVDDMDAITRGRLIVAVRDGKVGFSIKEYDRCKDQLENRHSGRLVNVVRGVRYFFGSLAYPNLYQ